MGRHKQFDEDEALDAALSVFWQNGYEGTSFDDLTKATGVARPGLYAAFGNKEALFRKALDLYGAKYMGFMTEALNEPTSLRVVERILRGSAVLHTMNSAHPGCLGLNGALACSDDAEPIRRELIRRRAATQLALRRRLERAQREGDLPSSVSCATLASFVMAVSQGMAVQAKAGASKKTLDGLVDHVLGTWPKTAR
ncbi:TetR family transcriptional regulator [Caballeronia sordidicola]|uniref:TetR family transcriptional regulator n=1 Tax=Caballeronia sordidicola TaxID=196367 RepID=A0A158GEG2_CABSO|nr:TetR/AcrR family transcriptional regulator [Caballeronia sordidicola]SAL30504.1 TetR family transcriptional regulator [Caballeronia sordidicola]